MEGGFHRLIVSFDRAFRQLGLPIELRTLESQALLVHKAMTVQARNYHDLSHCLGLVDPENPIQTLAALFHDIVYYQVDLGFLPEISELIAPYLKVQDQSFYLARGPAAGDRLFRLAREVFAVPFDQPLTTSRGLNEFLSALVMNIRLDGLVPDALLAQMDVCIEATIPFRGAGPDGRSHFETLYLRLSDINARWGFNLDEAGLKDVIRIAVSMANRDVESFANPQPAGFLLNTWKLLPEMNVPLRERSVYTIREYRQALQRLEEFFHTIDPEVIFHRYDGVPPEAEYERLAARARQNITIGRAYVQVKLVAQAILEALAMESGGDAPLALFMGDLPGEKAVHRLENYLPSREDPPWLDRASPVYLLLTDGRYSDTDFDLNVSPLSLFLFRSLTAYELGSAFDLAQEMFAGRLSAREFLLKLEPSVVSAVATASARMVSTRSDALLKYA